MATRRRYGAVEDVYVETPKAPELFFDVAMHAVKRMYSTSHSVNDTFMAPSMDANVPVRVFALTAVLPAYVRPGPAVLFQNRCAPSEVRTR